MNIRGGGACGGFVSFFRLWEKQLFGARYCNLWYGSLIDGRRANFVIMLAAAVPADGGADGVRGRKSRKGADGGRVRASGWTHLIIAAAPPPPPSSSRFSIESAFIVRRRLGRSLPECNRKPRQATRHQGRNDGKTKTTRCHRRRRQR